jgi:hypothetical protein
MKGGGRVNSPRCERDIEILCSRHSFGNPILRGLKIPLGHGDSCFPGQRMPSALRSRQRNLKKPVGLGPRLLQVSLREPKFREARFQ